MTVQAKSVKMKTKGFIISDPFSDESVGIYPQSWELKGDFDFDSQEDLDAFVRRLQSAFDLVCDDLPIVRTVEDIEEEEVRRENERVDAMEEYYNGDFTEDDFYSDDNGPTGHGDIDWSDADPGL